MNEHTRKTGFLVATMIFSAVFFAFWESMIY